MKIAALTASSLLMMLASACDAHAPSEEVAEGEDSLTATENLRGLREELLSADGSSLRTRCTGGRGKNRVTFDVFEGAGGDVVRARFMAKDWGGGDVDTSADLGAATIEKLPGDEPHYVFHFQLNGKQAHLDTGGAWHDPGGNLAVASLSPIPLVCESYDAPYHL